MLAGKIIDGMDLTNNWMVQRKWFEFSDWM